MLKIGLSFVTNFIRITRHCIHNTNQCAWLSSPSSYSPGHPFKLNSCNQPSTKKPRPGLPSLAMISVLNPFLFTSQSPSITPTNHTALTAEEWMIKPVTLFLKIKKPNIIIFPLLNYASSDLDAGACS